jgi:hypothetical protein
MILKIAARVRGLFAGNYGENREDEQVHVNSRGDLVVAPGLPELTELVRLGDSWQVANSAGQAALTALPTTTAGLSLWNGEPDTGRCYAIDSFGSWEAVVDATQTDVTAIFACNNKTPVAAPTDAALTVRSLSGKTYGGKARTLAGGTITNEGWFPHATPGAQMAAAAAGAQWKVNEVLCRGLYLVPPGGMFSVQAVKAAAAAAAQQFFFIRWHEVQLIVRT